MDGSAFRGIGEAITSAFIAVGVLLLVFIPLGLWKLIEVLIWLYRHVEIGWK